MLGNFCHSNYVPGVIRSLLPKFSTIWKSNENEYNKCLHSEIPNYYNTKANYFEYLSKAVYSIEGMIYSAAYINDKCLEYAIKLIDKHSNDIFKWISYVLNICHIELLTSNIYKSEIIAIYKYISDIILHFMELNESKNNNLTNI